MNYSKVLPALCMAIFLSACGGEPEDDAATPATRTQAAADLVLRGGTVATVDPTLGRQQAIAISGYEIAAVGSDEEIEAWIGPQTEVVELDGRFVMPGFIEGHGHFMGLGRAKQILDLSSVRNWEEI